LLEKFLNRAFKEAPEEIYKEILNGSGSWEVATRNNTGTENRSNKKGGKL